MPRRRAISLGPTPSACRAYDGYEQGLLAARERQHRRIDSDPGAVEVVAVEVAPTPRPAGPRVILVNDAQLDAVRAGVTAGVADFFKSEIVRRVREIRGRLD